MAYKRKNNRPPRPGEGRPSKYDPKYCKEIVAYFTVKPYQVKTMGKRGKVLIANDLRFLSAFARKIGVEHKTLDNWCHEHPEFLQAYTRAKQLQMEMLVSNGLNGTYDSRFAIFSAKNMIGWVDKSEIDHGVTDETLEKYKSLSIEELKAKLKDLLPGS